MQIRIAQSARTRWLALDDPAAKYVHELKGTGYVVQRSGRKIRADALEKSDYQERYDFGDKPSRRQAIAWSGDRCSARCAYAPSSALKATARQCAGAARSTLVSSASTTFMLGTGNRRGTKRGPLAGSPPDSSREDPLGAKAPMRSGWPTAPARGAERLRPRSTTRQSRARLRRSEAPFRAATARRSEAQVLPPGWMNRDRSAAGTSELEFQPAALQIWRVSDEHSAP